MNEYSLEHLSNDVDTSEVYFIADQIEICLFLCGTWWCIHQYSNVTCSQDQNCALQLLYNNEMINNWTPLTRVDKKVVSVLWHRMKKASKMMQLCSKKKSRLLVGSSTHKGCRQSVTWSNYWGRTSAYFITARSSITAFRNAVNNKWCKCWFICSTRVVEKWTKMSVVHVISCVCAFYALTVYFPTA